MRKGQVIAPTYILSFIFIIIVFIIGIYSIFAMNLRIKVGLVTATEGMQTLAILTKLVTDPSCLATEGGIIGIIDAEKVRKVAGSASEHTCAQLPNFGYVVRIDAGKNNWTFGQKGVVQARFPSVRSIPIAVRDGAKTHPGKITINTWYESGEDGDMLLRARSIAEQAWSLDGTYERAFSVLDYTIDYNPSEVCYEDKGGKSCRKYISDDIKVNDALPMGFDGFKVCKVRAERKGGEVELTQKCVPNFGQGNPDAPTRS